MIRKLVLLFSTALALCGCSSPNEMIYDRVHFHTLSQCALLGDIKTRNGGAYIRSTYFNYNGEERSINGFFPYEEFFLVEKGSYCIKCGTKEITKW